MRRTRTLRVTAMVASVVLCAPGASVAAGQTAASIDGMLAQADERSFAYDYEGALELAEAAVRIDPLHDEAHAMIRTLYARLGMREALEARYRELVATYPDSAAAYYFLSRAARSREAQEGYLRHALEVDPNYGPAALALASRLREPEQVSRALQLVSGALATMPGDYRAASSYVRLLQRLDRNGEAISFLKQMTAQYPHELRFWTRLWSMELRAVGRDARERTLERLLPQINAQRYRFMGSLRDMETLAVLFDSLGAAGSAEAVDLWRSIADRYPDHPRAEGALLRAVAAAPDVDTKRKALRVLTERYPASPARYAAYQFIISALVRDERYDEAIDLAKSLLDMPDPGFEDEGFARDPQIAEMVVFAGSLECLGYSQWFAAAQASLSGSRRSGMRAPRRLDEDVALSPEAGSAARGLATSTCESAIVWLTVGSFVGHHAAFRTLAIELLERGIAVARDNPIGGPAEMSSVVTGMADHYGELLPYLYLREGRLQDAGRAVDGLYRDVARRSSRFYRIAGEVYETVGRLEDAKRAYLRALADGAEGEFVRAALDRLYRALASDEIVVFDPEKAPRLPLAATRVRRVHLGIDAPAHRFVGDTATLILLWNVRMEPSRALAERLAKLADTIDAPGLATLSIAVDANANTAVRHLNRSPLPGGVDQSIAMTYDDLVRWGIEELPTTLLIDGDGRVRARQMSYGVSSADWLEGWRSIVAELLAESRPP